MNRIRNFSQWLSTSTAIMLLALVASCSSSDNDTEGIWAEPVAQSAPLHFVARLEPMSSDINNAKAINLGEDICEDAVEPGAKYGAPRHIIVAPDEDATEIEAKWAEGEKVGLIYTVGNTKYLSEARVESVADNGEARIEGFLEYAPTDNTPVKIVYPYAAADKDEESGVKAGYLKDGQDGTIATISSTFDVATADGYLDINGTDATLKQKVALENQYAILRLRFITAGSSPISNIHRLYVSNESTDEDIIIVHGSNLETIYVVMEPVSTQTTLRFTIISDEATYSNTASLQSLEASKYYKSSLGLNITGAGAVDLGLPSGRLWATCNVGAEKENYAPEAYGDFFAWGETTGYSSANNPPTDGRSFCWDEYTKFGTHSDAAPDYGFIKYNTTTPTPILEAANDDAAFVNWGRRWRMPTKTEFDELLTAYPEVADPVSGKYRAWLNNYNSTGVAGLAFYDASNNVLLFLPAAGLRYLNSLSNQTTGGRYWSSSLYQDDVQIAWYLSFNRDPNYSIMSNNGGRLYGRSVRPIVADKSTI